MADKYLDWGAVGTKSTAKGVVVVWDNRALKLVEKRWVPTPTPVASRPTRIISFGFLLGYMGMCLVRRRWSFGMNWLTFKVSGMTLSQISK